MNRGDVRAVENPISAVFDLAEDVNEKLPKIRKVLRYTRIFVTVWLVVDALFILVMPGVPLLQLMALVFLVGLVVLMFARRLVGSAASRTAFTVLAGAAAVLLVVPLLGNLLLGIILVGLLVLGLAILELLADLRRFIDYYALRHRVIRSVRDEDPIVYIPQGRDVVQRLLSFLAARSPQIQALMARPGTVLAPAILRGASGMTYQFDAFVGVQGSSTWRLFGAGSPGFSLFVKAFDRPPSQRDMQALKHAAEDVCMGSKAPPSRVIAVWKATGDQGLDTAAYDYVTTEVVDFTHRGNRYSCSLEVITESSDGTYDFVPFITDGVPTL